MTTDNYHGIGYNTKGKDHNIYKKFTVSATTFGGDSVSGEQPDYIANCVIQSFMMLNESTLSTEVVEYSFNGNTVHGELDPTLASKAIAFDNRSFDKIWFRVKAGSTGPVTIRLDAWGSK